MKDWLVITRDFTGIVAQQIVKAETDFRARQIKESEGFAVLYVKGKKNEQSTATI
jgi:hypothetical protein